MKVKKGWKLRLIKVAEKLVEIINQIMSFKENQAKILQLCMRTLHYHNFMIQEKEIS